MTDEKREIPVFGKKQDSIEKILDDFEKLYEDEICASNNLLGRFVEGKYVISREIKEDLVKHKKILTSEEDKKTYCILRHEYDVFHLTLFIDEFGEEKQVAKLYLIEKIQEEDIDLKSFIAEFISDKRPDFMFKAQAVFNIVLTDESKGKDDDEDEFEDLKNIQKKIVENQKQKEEDLEFMTEMYSETYVKKMIEELKKMGPKGEKILKEFKEKVEKQKAEEKVSSKVYTKLKKQLDVIIKKNGGLKELVKQNPNITKVVKEYTEPIKAYKQLMKKDVVVGKPDKEVKKEEKSSSPSKKPAAKAKKAEAKKAPAKKAPAKKADKKEAKKPAKKKDKKKDDKNKYKGLAFLKKDSKKEEKAEQKTTKTPPTKKATPQKPVEPNIKKNGDLIITPINVELLDDTLNIIKTGLELKKTQSLEESLDNVVEAREKAPNADNVRPRETEAFEAVNLAGQEAERQMPDDVLNEASEGSSKMDELFENIKHKEHQKGPQKE